MGLHIDGLADIIRTARDDSDATRADFEAALAQVFDHDDAELGEAMADLDRGVGKWVSIVFVDGESFDEAWEAADESHAALADILTSWDYGTETDAAHTTDGGQWGTHDRVSVHTYGGLTYVLAVNASLGYASLNRRPLTTA